MHQRLSLEALHITQRQPILGRIEQATERPFQCVGHERRLQRIGLEKKAEAGQRALFGRGAGEICKRRPERLLDLGRHFQALGGEQRRDPFRRPCALGIVVDIAHGLEFQRIPRFAAAS